MPGEFIPELHDIGKLLSEQAKEGSKGIKGHTLENIDFTKLGILKPTSPSWWTQYHHSIREDIKINDWNEIPPNYRWDVFLLCIADRLASSISRATPPLTRELSGQMVKLWNRGFTVSSGERGIDLNTALTLIDSVTNSETFLNNYRNLLMATPEDKAKPRNITSLYTHLLLAGKIYRVLKRSFEVKGNFTIREASGGPRTTGEKDVEPGQWQGKLVKCFIKFPHSFVRLKDINYLKHRKELVEKFVNEHRDNVLFYSSDFICLFLPPKDDVTGMFSHFVNNGFYIECVEIVADLGILSSNLDTKTLRARAENDQCRLAVLNNRQTRVRRRVLMANYPDEIAPPICDICQLRPATERIRENIKEWICDKCNDVRSGGESLHYPDDWEGQKVVWLKFGLNTKKLEQWLVGEFERYVSDLNDPNLVGEFRPLACAIDFVNDYNRLITEFWAALATENINPIRPIEGYDEIGVCRYSGDAVRILIKSYLDVYSRIFPDCTGDDDAPISLSLSVANIKFPVREHWRYFEDPKGFLNIRHHNVFEDTYTKDEAEWLLAGFTSEQDDYSHYIHRLTGLYSTLNSDALILVETIKNRDQHPQVYNLYSKVQTTPRKMLNFFQLLKRVDETPET